MFRELVLGAAGFAAMAANPAAARPVTDCPNRDLPFSAASPMIDLLLSDAARAVLNRHSGGKFAQVPQGYMGTRPPTFAAIMTMKEAARFTGMSTGDIAAADADLRRLPVTAADKVVRCARYDNDLPKFELPSDRPRILMFEKITGFRDEPSVNAANAAVRAMAARKGWALAVTDKGGAFNLRTLRQFDAVIWNNISGDVLTLSQRRGFQRYLAAGGAYVGLHGAAGDSVYFWDWYPDTLIGARFKGHPKDPQFQEARIVVDQAHPLAKALPAEWRMTDEWYSFRTNPRTSGAKVLLSLDERSYSPVGAMGADMRMGNDHPIAWTNCIGPRGRGRGRMFYSAIGHRPETYAEPNHVRLLEAAIEWAATDKQACRQN